MRGSMVEREPLHLEEGAARSLWRNAPRTDHAHGPAHARASTRARTLTLRDELEVVDLLEKRREQEDHEKMSQESRERGGRVEEDVLRRAPGRVHALATPSEPRT